MLRESIVRMPNPYQKLKMDQMSLNLRSAMEEMEELQRLPLAPQKFPKVCLKILLRKNKDNLMKLSPLQETQTWSQKTMSLTSLEISKMMTEHA